MGERKPEAGPQAEMLARLRTITEEARKLRRELHESIRPSATPPRGADMDYKPKRRKRR